jgi:hypothetical protein
MLDSEITKQMTPDEYITLAGKYCERMEWNHDAIPELAKCLEQHDLMVVLKFARRTMDMQTELEHENTKLREKVKNQAHRIRFFEGATNHAGGVKAREIHSQGQSEWMKHAGLITFSAEVRLPLPTDSALPNVV